MEQTAGIRQHQGIKLKLAKEFVGFTEPDKKFRELAREAGVGTKDEAALFRHKLYLPFEIRKIRQTVMNITADSFRAPPPVIPFRMSKGGVGKTTISTNVGTCFAQFGYRTLLIEGDPQGSMSKQLGFNINQKLTHIGNILERLSKGQPTRIEDAIVPIYDQGMLDLIPADITLSNIDAWMNGAMNREHLFARLMEKESEFFKRYDVVIIDSAPNTSILTTSFLVACKMVTAVVMPEAQSVLAIEGLESNIEEINRAYPDRKHKLGLHIIANRYRQSYQSHNDAIEKLATDYGKYMNDTIVRDFVGFLRETDMDDVTKSAPVLEKEPNSVGARDIIDVTKSLIKLYNVKLTAP
jgi:chromosome partitioning protein